MPALCAGKMHPFGKEEAASVEHLFEFFCECLKHGEWELAQACVPQLHKGHGDIPKKVEKILQTLVSCPGLMRCEQHKNPQRLAWIWLLMLEKWLEWDLDLQHEGEFFIKPESKVIQLDTFQWPLLLKEDWKKIYKVSVLARRESVHHILPLWSNALRMENQLLKLIVTHHLWIICCIFLCKTVTGYLCEKATVIAKTWFGFLDRPFSLCSAQADHSPGSSYMFGAHIMFLAVDKIRQTLKSLNKFIITT
ncbi:zinc finger FYVE domain-containing protein 26-like isoform X2 [Petaurus breviceps papuanus]|uniref:zinc finger FYVE domain-containing protein 26-like isoform X2 n=1 Tax=Petaurus breviceps papuanus TaxID=3040969 RepID=UPI0036D9E3CE